MSSWRWCACLPGLPACLPALLLLSLCLCLYLSPVMASAIMWANLNTWLLLLLLLWHATGNGTLAETVAARNWHSMHHFGWWSVPIYLLPSLCLPCFSLGCCTCALGSHFDTFRLQISHHIKKLCQLLIILIALELCCFNYTVCETQLSHSLSHILKHL